MSHSGATNNFNGEDEGSTSKMMVVKAKMGGEVL